MSQVSYGISILHSIRSVKMKTVNEQQTSTSNPRVFPAAFSIRAFKFQNIYVFLTRLQLQGFHCGMLHRRRHLVEIRQVLFSRHRERVLLPLKWRKIPSLRVHLRSAVIVNLLQSRIASKELLQLHGECAKTPFPRFATPVTVSSSSFSLSHFVASPQMSGRFSPIKMANLLPNCLRSTLPNTPYDGHDVSLSC